jgi:hypothetical protein
MHPGSGREPPTNVRTPVEMQDEIGARERSWKPVIQRDERNGKPE